MKIGKPKYGGEFVPTKYWKLKDGESTFRILPPIGELADDGIWSMFYRVHYGYRNSFGKMRVFQSSLVTDRASKMVTVPDAAVERIDKLKAELEKAKSSGHAMSIAKLKELLQQYNLDSNHYVNAMDLQGNIGVLKLRHRAKQALDATIKKLNGAGIDPLSPEEGLFLTFTRSGMGLDTTFQVSVAQREENIPGVGKVKRDMYHTLTPEIIARLGKEARELGKLFKAISSDDIGRIVSTCDLNTGKSSAIDEIFDAKTGSGSDEAEDFGDEGSGGTTGGGPGGNVSSGGQGGASFSGPAPEVQITLGGTVTMSGSGAIDVLGNSDTAQSTAQKVSSMSEEEFQKYIASLGI
jgi:hypothetical protein